MEVMEVFTDVKFYLIQLFALYFPFLVIFDFDCFNYTGILTALSVTW